MIRRSKGKAEKMTESGKRKGGGIEKRLAKGTDEKHFEKKKRKAAELQKGW